MSTPQSTIYICSGVRLDNRYEHSIYFKDATAQQGYFAGKVVKTFPAYSYLRKTWPLQVQATMEEARSWSYLYFRNGTGKFYYYFINQIEYKNDNTVELSLELDVLQTYLFDFEMLDSFVERQHTETDSIGEHTVDEGLDLGTLVTTSTRDIQIGEMCILVMSTIDLVKPTIEVENDKWWELWNPTTTVLNKMIATNYDGVFGGAGIYAIEATDWSALGQILLILDDGGYSDCVVSIWMYPKKLVALAEGYDWSTTVVNKVHGIQPFTEEFSAPTTLNGYTPDNKKLLTYPYCMLYATNNGSGGASYRFERFADRSSCGFKVTGALTPEGATRLYPIAYDGEALAYDHGLTLTGFPTCAWAQDVYKLWLAQNQNQQDLSMALSVLSVVGGVAGAVATGGTGAMLGLGSAISGAQNIAGILAQRRDMAIQPPQAKGQVSTSVNTVAGFQTFTMKTKTLTKEMAKVIDGYFSMYGYKLNQVRKPNLCARSAFTYIKTVGCNISGAKFCTEDRNRITGIFDKGITFWVNGDKIADYSQTNTPKEV